MKMNLKVEQLERRETPAGFSQAGSMLVYSGDIANHNVAITDDGNGNVIGTLDANPPQFFSGVSQLDILSMSGGSDNIDYVVTGPRHGETVMVETGAGTNFTADLSAGVASGNNYFIDYRFGNSGKTIIGEGPVAAKASEYTFEYSDFSSGSVAFARKGDIAGTAMDTFNSVSDTTAKSLSFSGNVTGYYLGVYYGWSAGPGGSMAMTIDIGAASTGKVKAVEWGDTSGGDTLFMHYLDASNDPNDAGGRIDTVNSNLSNVTTSGNVAVQMY